MQFHPEKCFTLRVTNKTKPLKSNYTIHGHTLLSAIDQVPKSQQKRARQEEEASGKAIPNTAKYLGVYINGKLSWNHHVDAVTKKATSTLWFLHRNTASCPRPVKEYCYKAYIRPQLEYASTVWTPHTQRNINQLEMVQRRAARYVYRDFSPYSSPTTMLQQLGWETLEMRRQKAQLIMMYRIKNQLIDIPASLYAPPPQRVTRGHPHQIMIERTRLNVYAQSYFPAVQRPWNALPASVACAPTLDAFKQQLDDAAATSTV